MYGTKFIEEEDIDLLSRTNQINFDNEATSFGEVAKQIIKKDLQIIRKQEGIIGH